PNSKLSGVTLRKNGPIAMVSVLAKAPNPGWPIRAATSGPIWMLMLANVLESEAVRTLPLWRLSALNSMDGRVRLALARLTLPLIEGEVAVSFLKPAARSRYP